MCRRRPICGPDRVAKKFADRVPQLVTAKDGSEQWFVDGQMLLDGRTARAGALMADRNEDPKRWADVPAPAFTPAERLKAMDSAGIDYSVLYPTVAGLAGETFGRLQDSELEIACVRAYNDWLIDEWASASDRFIPAVSGADLARRSGDRRDQARGWARPSRRDPAVLAHAPARGSAYQRTRVRPALVGVRRVGRAGLSPRRRVRRNYSRPCRRI